MINGHQVAGILPAWPFHQFGHEATGAERWRHALSALTCRVLREKCGRSAVFCVLLAHSAVSCPRSPAAS